MHPTLYTLGYQQRKLDEYVQLLLDARINVVIDVRKTAWSHKPGFSKVAFARALAANGIDYMHAQFAGNPKRLRARAPSHEVCLRWYARLLDEQIDIVETFEEVVRYLSNGGRRICITCFERHADDCHRSILADRWRERAGGRVEHLATDGCERLIGD